METKNALMPVDRIQKTLRELRSGEEAWAVPWACSVGSDRRIWIDLEFGSFEHQGGSVQLLVKRVDSSFECTLYDNYEYFYNVTEDIGPSLEPVTVFSFNRGETS